MTDFGREVKHSEYERACANIERDREMFHGAISGEATDADRQRWCEQALASTWAWLAMADSFVRSYSWGQFRWTDRCEALDELNRMRKELKA